MPSNMQASIEAWSYYLENLKPSFLESYFWGVSNSTAEADRTIKTKHSDNVIDGVGLLDIQISRKCFK